MSYLPPGQERFGGLRHLALVYGSGKRPYDEEDLLHHVAHLDETGKPDGWLFDSLLFIETRSPSGRDYLADVNAGTTMSGEGDFRAVCSPRPARSKDWDALVELYFGKGAAVSTLEAAVARAARTLGAPPRPRNVVLALPYPHVTRSEFSTKGRSLERATRARLDAERRFVDRLVARWKRAIPRHLNLLGVYWIFESLHRSWDIDDHVLLRELKAHVNAKGLAFLWIPFHSTYHFHLLQGYERYFDLAFLQPNFMFYREGKTVEETARQARRTGAGLEMEYYLELDEPLKTRGERRARFREYLNGGVKYGYMRDAACAWFLGRGAPRAMRAHEDAQERAFYEDIRAFITGDYLPKPYPQTPKGAAFKPKERLALALDLGGTNVRAALVDEYGKILERRQAATPQGRDAILEALVSTAGAALEAARTRRAELIGVGASTGGRVDAERGVVLDSTKSLAGWSEVPLGSLLRKRLGLPALIDNDGHCAARAERAFGAGRGIEDFVCLSLGTGIGGGVVSGGRLLRGARGLGAELGHMSVDAAGPECSCGGRGCVELYASGAGLERWARERGVTREDPALLRDAGERLGLALAGLINAFNPRRVILTGTLAALGGPYHEALRKTALSRALKPLAESLDIVVSPFPQDAGLLGAASLVLS